MNILSYSARVMLTLLRWRELKQQYDLKRHDAKLLSDSLKQSDHGQQLDEINQLESTIGLWSSLCGSF